ncbi:MAG TPA: hypothetical protein VEH86_04420 [Candidatus Acidoferrum sp.]|nr:hypothetical protein [Candidatus Acidoferrum sp.]
MKGSQGALFLNSEVVQALIKRITIVLAKYCPHCVPFSLHNAHKMAEDFGVPLRVLDIEIPEQLEAADRLVEEHGDWSEDYLIPQVFVEYDDGKIDHLLTGFSEAVSATEASWKALFSSSYYQSLQDEKEGISHSHTFSQGKSLEEFVEKYLKFQGQCKHCDEPSSLVLLQSDPKNIIGAYVCPNRYVSRVVYFSVNPDIKLLKAFLYSQVGKQIVADRDIRPATRHGWELGSDALAEIGKVSPNGVIKEVYWTVYPKTEDERNMGIFLCSHSEKGSRIGRLFIQDKKSRNTLCPKCKT